VKLFRESHLYGETILRQHFSDEYNELRTLLDSATIPLRPAGPFNAGGAPPKRQLKKVGGAKKRILLPADMKEFNKQLDRQLRKNGWRGQPVASGSTIGTSRVRLRGDFEKNGVFVEVEFGNSASLFRDLFKFQVANREKRGEVGVLVTATRQLMKFHDSGVTTHELIDGLRPYLALSIQMPIWIVGLEPDTWSAIQDRYDEMYDVTTTNGEAAHPFSDIFGAAIAIEDTPEESDLTIVEK
jgi:hypothetical protein